MWKKRIIVKIYKPLKWWTFAIKRRHGDNSVPKPCPSHKHTPFNSPLCPFAQWPGPKILGSRQPIILNILRVLASRKYSRGVWQSELRNVGNVSDTHTRTRTWCPTGRCWVGHNGAGMPTSSAFPLAGVFQRTKSGATTKDHSLSPCKQKDEQNRIRLGLCRLLLCASPPLYL